MPYRRRNRRFTATEWERLGRAAKRERALHNLSQAELARASRVSTDVIERLERTPHSGSEILATNLYKIENALGWGAGTAEQILTDRSSFVPTPPPEVNHRSLVIERIRDIPG